MVLGHRSQVFNLLAKLASQDLRAAFARGSDKANGETWIVGHGNQRGFSVARKTLDADLPRIHRFVGLQVVQSAAGAPSPGAQRAPIIELARLAFIGQTDNARGQTTAIIGLKAGGDDHRIAPALDQELLLPCWAAAVKGSQLRRGHTLSHSGNKLRIKGELHNYGNG